MSTSKWGITLSPGFRTLPVEIRTQTANAIADNVIEEFHTMLKDAPQFSGNYVANMKLEAGSSTSSSAEQYFPIPKSVTEAYARGDLPAIAEAKQNAAGFKEAFVAKALSGRGSWLSQIVVYNPLEYASLVEGHENLRAENQEGRFALQKMAERLRNSRISLNLKHIR